MALVYHSVECQNVKDEYQAGETLDFEITFENRNLLANTIRLEGDLRVKQNNANVTMANNIKMDSRVGAVGLIESISCETQQQGLLESIQDVGRLARMVADATMTENDYFQSTSVCELKTGNEQLSQALLLGIDNIPSGNNATVVNLDNNFSMMLPFCFNRVSGDTTIGYNKTGTIRVSINLSRVFGFLYGGADGTTSYSLKNVRLCYKSLPQGTKSGGSKSVMRTHISLKSSVASQFANISTKVPAVCDSVSVSFQQQNREFTASHNNHDTEELPSVKEVQFLFQDSTNTYVTYQVRDRTDVLHKYLESLGSKGSNDARLLSLKANQSYGIGLRLPRPLDLSNQKFNIQIDSNVSSANPYIAYLFFHSFLEL